MYKRQVSALLALVIAAGGGVAPSASAAPTKPSLPAEWKYCLLYTSDAADDLLCVALGGRRIIKKKNSYPELTDLQ